ncbi:hypothetical protein BCV70DRAFT_204346 [Testicularia cyperi]|uniref:Uncharacterized protein n=1 Tax=Testicularia cyperi TaxID=1882483 RepID=A0A317Y0L9_9BASI|nr:hypothetical protein BCV70DRAFT_204346 [Testicularia cyperi]
MSSNSFLPWATGVLSLDVYVANASTVSSYTKSNSNLHERGAQRPLSSNPPVCTHVQTKLMATDTDVYKTTPQPVQHTPQKAHFQEQLRASEDDLRMEPTRRGVAESDSVLATVFVPLAWQTDPVGMSKLILLADVMIVGRTNMAK